jgi:ELWxxDGT repeat protein
MPRQTPAAVACRFLLGRPSWRLARTTGRHRQSALALYPRRPRRAVRLNATRFTVSSRAMALVLTLSLGGLGSAELASAAPRGTPRLVEDLNPGLGSANPGGLTNFGGTLFFSATDRGLFDGDLGRELWKSDGTAGGTRLVKDVSPGLGSSNPHELTTINGKLLFAASLNGCSDGGCPNTELWESDGTAAGTKLLKDIDSSGGGSDPNYLTVVNDTVFFWAQVREQTPPQLWRSDGTAAGTMMVKDITPTYLTSVKRTLFFLASDSTHGYELWKSDGTASGTTMVKDINRGEVTSSPQNLTNVNGTLFFAADDGAGGQELWKSDGTSAGTQLVKRINPGPDSSYPHGLTNVNGTVFFNADDGTAGFELWKSDGTAAGTKLVKDINPGPGSGSPSGLSSVNGAVFFGAWDGGAIGGELWKSDGTAAGTQLVKDINPGPESSNLFDLTAVDREFFFNAYDAGGSELWRSDGTAAGTTLVKDINPGPGSSTPWSLTNVEGALFFTANDGLTGNELWRLR